MKGNKNMSRPSPKTKGAQVNLPDLTQSAPRSARVRLGRYVILPRMLDKGRATLQGKNGDYHFNCPLDQRFVAFVGIDPEKLKSELAKGKGDGEILEWINTQSTSKPKPWEVSAWSAFQEARGPDDVESRAFFNDLLAKVSKTREDISSWFDLLDLDDYASFGGKA
jgi:hypothetical protein